MKKLTAVFATIGAILCMGSAYAADLRFEPDGGGYFIYCNNNEFIRRMDLSDISNPEPAYLMNNLNMTNGKYTLYFSHVNHTEIPGGGERPEDTADMNINSFTAEQLEQYYETEECGFDIETDVEFKAKTDTKIRFTALGFEVQQPLNYYYTNRFIRYEEPWACLGAVADYMQRPIFDCGSVEKFYPTPFEPFEIEIGAGDTAWLSKYIKNYAVVPWMKPVHLLTDFEIVYGCADINIAALKSGDVVGDRSHHCPDAAHGRFYRDRQYKGVADTLPSVTAELEYTIDEGTADGELLPVTLFNQYVPEGHRVTEWITHINTQGDRSVNRFAAESDMLRFEYFDPSKAELYGAAVPKEERDKIWVFDVFHSDIKRFDPTLGVATRETFVPNYRLSVLKSNSRSSGNFANYCVRTNYRLKIKNECSQSRFFNYEAKTSAGIVVSVKDKNGKYSGENAVHKVYDGTAKNEALACVELAPNEVTEFIVEVFLPINYVGGIKNSFKITHSETRLSFPQDMKQGNTLDLTFTGKDFVKWQNGVLLRSADGEVWSEVETSEEVRKIFEGNFGNYRIKYLNGNYTAMWYTFVPTPSYYAPWLKYKSDIYFFDDDFRLLKTANVGSYPWEISAAGGKFFVKADKIFESADGGEWTESPFQELNLPIDNGGPILAPKTGGDMFLSPDDGESFYRIAYRADVKPPRYAEVLGDLYFFAEGSDISFSRDGVEWVKATAGEKIRTVSRAGDAVLVNGEKIIEASQVPVYTNVIIDDEVMQYDRQVQNHSYGIGVPLEMSMEKIGAKYSLNPKNGRVQIEYGGKVLELSVGSNMLKVNGDKRYMDFGTRTEYGRVFIPAEQVFAALGYESRYFEKSRCLVLKKREEVIE